MKQEECIIAKSCECAWEPDRDCSRFLQKYKDFPTRGLRKKGMQIL